MRLYLKTKSIKENSFEVAFSLFTSCNLNCDFCFEEHSNDVDCSFILESPYIIFDNIKKFIEQYKIKKIRFLLWGGELFQDKLDDSIFEVYKKSHNTFISLCKNEFPDLSISTVWTSNGVFSNYKRVQTLLYDTNGSISFSYDPVDRLKTKNNIKLWLDNFYRFKTKDFCVSTTLTKASVEKYIDGDYIFDSVLRNVYIDINHYAANKKWENFILTDDITYSFYRWALSNKRYNIILIQLLLESYIYKTNTRICNCKFACQFSKDGFTQDCVKRSSVLNRKLFYGDENVTEENVSDIKANIGMTKRGCFTCEHYTYCPMNCWLEIIFKHYVITECPLKRLYNDISEKDVDIYLRWKSTH